MGVAPMNVESLAAELRAALGADAVRSGANVPVRNASDAGRLPPVSPPILVLPSTAEDIATTLRCCAAAGWPIVVQGGLTGLAGGAHPEPGEVALSTERMTGIEEIDIAAGTLTALAGTTLQAIQDAADAAGFLCGIDLGARGSCTIGGNVATNAGGHRVLRYGTTRHNVLGLETVLADGTIVTSMNKMLKNNAGYDWTQLFIGSEGTLGVITRVVLSLYPAPRGVATAFCSVKDVASAIAVQRVLERDLPGRLLAFEALWPEVIGIAERTFGLQCPFEESYGLGLLIEVDVSDSEAVAFETCLAHLYERGALREALLARSESDRSRFWRFRETPYEYRGRFGTLVSFDVSLPRATMAEALEAIHGRVAAALPEAVTAIFGHLADSNVHIIILCLAYRPDVQTRLDPIVYGLVGEYGGSVSAEHGIGTKKREFLHLCRSRNEIGLMIALKRALDPQELLNRGRILGSIDKNVKDGCCTDAAW